MVYLWIGIAVIMVILSWFEKDKTKKVEYVVILWGALAIANIIGSYEHTRDRLQKIEDNQTEIMMNQKMILAGYNGEDETETRK